MTLFDTRPERRHQASETRELGEQETREAARPHISGQAFWVAFVVIAAVITIIALVLRS